MESKPSFLRLISRDAHVPRVHSPAFIDTKVDLRAQGCGGVSTLRYNEGKSLGGPIAINDEVEVSGYKKTDVGDQRRVYQQA